MLQAATNEALTHNQLVTQVASSLNSPRIGTRKLVLDLLTFLVYWNTEAINLAISGLETLSVANNEGDSPYAFWFKSMEVSLMGRGKMGSLVGASEDMRKNAGGLEGSLNEYAVSLAY